MLYPLESKLVLDAAFAVHKELGPGLLELPYHNALYYELVHAGCVVGYNAPFAVSYRGEVVGEYNADLVVNSLVVLEVKSVAVLGAAHTAQLLNYLRLSGCRLGFLLNFQPPRLEFRRLVL
jgi:GxxExxY protein